jgi:hypothetical protein
MRWLIAPLVGALALSVSGFLGTLESTTERSAQLAAASDAAPRTTAAAAERVGTLPLLADLTSQQAAAFKELSAALDISAERVFALNEALGRQALAVGGLEEDLLALDGSVRCVSRRLDRLNGAAAGVPPAIEGITRILSSLVSSQEKSLRHLRSINRKLTALGAVATATDVQAPPPPPEPDFEAPVGGRPARDC